MHNFCIFILVFFKIILIVILFILAIVEMLAYFFMDLLKPRIIIYTYLLNMSTKSQLMIIQNYRYLFAMKLTI